MDKKIISAALKASGHYYDFDTNTLYLSNAFAKNSNTYGTNEYHLLNQILGQYPGVSMEIIKHKHRDVLTYKLMEDYIRIMPNAVANITEYKNIKLQSHAYRSEYKFVAAWFEKKFPNYGKLLIKDENGNLTWSALEEYDKACVEAKELALNVRKEGDV